MSRRPDSEKARAWRQRLQRFERSSFTITDFCSAEDVSEATFHYWRRRLAKQSPTRAPVIGSQGHGQAQRHVGFMPVRVSLSTVDIHLPNGTRVSIPSTETSALRVVIEAALHSEFTPENAQ